MCTPCNSKSFSKISFWQNCWFSFDSSKRHSICLNEKSVRECGKQCLHTTKSPFCEIYECCDKKKLCLVLEASRWISNFPSYYKLSTHNEKSISWKWQISWLGARGFESERSIGRKNKNLPADLFSMLGFSSKIGPFWMGYNPPVPFLFFSF